MDVHVRITGSFSTDFTFKSSKTFSLNVISTYERITLALRCVLGFGLTILPKTTLFIEGQFSSDIVGIVTILQSL